MTVTFDAFLAALKAANCYGWPEGSGFRARCPVHSDETPSMTFSRGETAEVVATCHSQGCPFPEMVRALNLGHGDPPVLYPDPPRRRRNGTRNGGPVPGEVLVATYNYVDADGVIRHRTLRYDPKRFAQDSFRNGTWVPSLAGVDLVLYRLPQLLAAPAEEWIVFCEGEKDADNAAAAGFVATTTAMGATNWGRTDLSPLRGRRVFVVGHNDDAGRQGAEGKAHALLGRAAAVKVVSAPPDLDADHADLTDFLATFGPDALRRLIAETPELRPPPPPRPSPFDEDRLAGPFPLDVYPGELAHFARVVADTLPCPPDYVGTGMLPVLAVGIGTARRIAMSESWSERPRLWAAIIGDSGALKSPAFDLYVAPVDAKERRFHLEYVDALEEYEDLRAAWEQTKSGPRPEPPVQRRIMTDDPTTAALTMLLAAHPAILVAKDELVAWLRSMGEFQRGRSSDRPKYLAMHSGKTIIRDRAGEGPSHILEHVVCIVGNLTPGSIHEFDSGAGEDGLLPRLLVTYPDAAPVPDDDDDELPGVPVAVQDRYAAVWEALWALSPGVDGPVPVGWTADGHATLRRWIKPMQRACQRGDVPEEAAAAFAKMPRHLLRIALVLACARSAACGGDEVVDSTIAEAAVALADYFCGQALRVARLPSGRVSLSPPKDMLAADFERRKRAALRHARRHGGWVELRELYRNKVAGIRTSAEAAVIAQALVDDEKAVLETRDNRAGYRLIGH